MPRDLWPGNKHDRKEPTRNKRMAASLFQYGSLSRVSLRLVCVCGCFGFRERVLAATARAEDVVSAVRVSVCVCVGADV